MGQGTTFSVYLPPRCRGGQAIQTAGQQIPRTGSPPVASSSWMMKNAVTGIMQEVLTAAGHTVAIAGNGWRRRSWLRKSISISLSSILTMAAETNRLRRANLHELGIPNHRHSGAAEAEPSDEAPPVSRATPEAIYSFRAARGGRSSRLDDSRSCGAIKSRPEGDRADAALLARAGAILTTFSGS